MRLLVIKQSSTNDKKKSHFGKRSGKHASPEGGPLGPKGSVSWDVRSILYTSRPMVVSLGGFARSLFPSSSAEILHGKSWHMENLGTWEFLALYKSQANNFNPVIHSETFSDISSL